MFHRLLTLDRQANVIEGFVIDQQLQFISFGKSIHQAFAMLIGPTWQIAGDADVKYSIASVGHDVNETPRHALKIKDVDGRDKPGHDEVCNGVASGEP
jgi:hypothetical protein